MTPHLSRRQMLAAGLAALPTFGAFRADVRAENTDQLNSLVAEAIRPVMKEHDVPGLAIGITLQGKRRFFNFGIASKASGQKVSEDTLFEIGSISKTFTATLGAHAAVTGALSLDDKASKYLPALAGSAFDEITLLELATYTSGGLPLQFPGNVTDHDKMLGFLKSWRPLFPPGTRRQYSNPSIALFGYLAAESLGAPFDQLMEQKIFPAFGLKSSYINIPKDQMGRYAFGYSKSGKPVRVSPGVLDAEAYGVKTTSADFLRFLEGHMTGAGLDDSFRRAIRMTQGGYYKVGPMTQGLGWESYPASVSRDGLLAGNSLGMIFKPNKADKLDPPLPARSDALYNKTGSTNGFGAYALFIPARATGIVLLANKAYPIPARVAAAHQILTALKG